MAAPAGLELYKEILDYYDKQKFCDADGSINTTTVVTRTTQILLERGLKNTSEIQQIGQIIPEYYRKQIIRILFTGTLNHGFHPKKD